MKVLLIAMLALVGFSTATLAAKSKSVNPRIDSESNVQPKRVRVPTGYQVPGCADYMLTDGGRVKLLCSEKDQIMKQLNDAVNRAGGSE